jgi:hypothetical protein
MPVDPPYQFIAEGLLAGEVIPFFGAAASAVYRPMDEPWRPGKPFIPAPEKACKVALADLLAIIKTLLPILPKSVSQPQDATNASWGVPARCVQAGAEPAIRQNGPRETPPMCQPLVWKAELGVARNVAFRSDGCACKRTEHPNAAPPSSPIISPMPHDNS